MKRFLRLYALLTGFGFELIIILLAFNYLEEYFTPLLYPYLGQKTLIKLGFLFLATLILIISIIPIFKEVKELRKIEKK